MKKRTIRILSFVFAIIAIFTIFPVSAFAASYPDGTVITLAPKCAPNMRLDVSGGSTNNGANIQIYQKNNTAAQCFRIMNAGGGNYYLISVASSKAVEVKGGKKASGTNVQLYSYNMTDAQIWKIVSAGGGYYYIKPYSNTNLCLDVSGGGTRNGTNVHVWTSNGSDAQKWKLYLAGTNSYDYFDLGTVSEIKSISTYNKPASWNVTTDRWGSSTSFTIAPMNQLGGTIIPYKKNNGKYTVIVKDENGKIIKNLTCTGTRKITISNLYPSYTIEVSRYEYESNGFWSKIRGFWHNRGWEPARSCS